MSFFDEGDEPTRVSRPARPRRPATGPRSSARPGGADGARPGPAHRARPAGGAHRRRPAVPDPLRRRHQRLPHERPQARAEGLQPQRLCGHHGLQRFRQPAVLPAAGQRHRAVGQPAVAGQPAADRRRGGRQARQRLRRAQRDEARPGRPDAGRSNFRASALGKIADQIPTATAQTAGSASSAADAINKIAGQMQAFLASDVVYSQRVIPYIKETLDSNGIGGQQIATSSFLPGLSWLSPAYVGSKVNARVGGRSPNGTPAPGTHGHGIDSVSIGGVTMQPSPAVNRIPAGIEPDRRREVLQPGPERRDRRPRAGRHHRRRASRSRRPRRSTRRRPARPRKRRSRSRPRRRSGLRSRSRSRSSAFRARRTSTNNKAQYTAIFQR